MSDSSFKIEKSKNVVHKTDGSLYICFELKSSNGTTEEHKEYIFIKEDGCVCRINDDSFDISSTVEYEVDGKFIQLEQNEVDTRLDVILNYCIPELKPEGNINGLNDVLLRHYINITEGIDNSLTNFINESSATERSIDQVFSKDCHYSPFFTVNNKDYGLDTLGDKHAFINRENLALKYRQGHCPKQDVVHLNPFGLDYQNNSNACGIWSANILNQVQAFKNTNGEDEVIKTYIGSYGKPYQILNPEILLRAAAQVSKDLTPKGQQLEIRILQEGQQVEKDYVPLKIGNTTFAIDTQPIDLIDVLI